MTKNEWVERLKSEHTKARVLAEVVGAAHLVDWARSTKGEQSDLEQQAIDKLEGKSTIYWKATRDSIRMGAGNFERHQ